METGREGRGVSVMPPLTNGWHYKIILALRGRIAEFYLNSASACRLNSGSVRIFSAVSATACPARNVAS